MDELLMEVVEVAKRRMEAEGNHPLTFFIVQGDDGLEVVMAVGDDRDVAFEELKRLVNEYDAKRYFIAFAGWKTVDGVRSEVLLVSEFDKKKGVESLVFEVVRGDGYLHVVNPERLSETSFNFWNVWSKYQVNLEVEEDEE